MRQQNSRVVDFILPHSAAYLRIQKWKNYWNRSIFAKVIVKIKVAQFFDSHFMWHLSTEFLLTFLHSSRIAIFDFF